MRRGGGAYGLTNGGASKSGIHGDIGIGRKPEHKVMQKREKDIHNYIVQGVFLTGTPLKSYSA